MIYTYTVFEPAPNGRRGYLVYCDTTDYDEARSLARDLAGYVTGDAGLVIADHTDSPEGAPQTDPRKGVTS